MFTPPAEPPTWGQCVLTVERHVGARDWRAVKFSMRKINRVTGVRFRFVKEGGQIKVSYDSGVLSPNTLAQTSVQGDRPIFWSGVLLNRDAMSGLSRRDRRAVVLHEFGHVFGLGHKYDKPNRVMFAWQNGQLRWSRSERARLRSGGGCSA